MEEFLTIRERIIELLRSTSRPLTAREIIEVLGVNITDREVYEHLAHIAKTIRSRSQGREVLLMEPPTCRKCGYVFKDLEKPKKPSRCPRCKSEWISPPRFIISRE
ncbi:MAG: transcriptional regulator [Desulfurococcaceae archaeon]